MSSKIGKKQRKLIRIEFTYDDGVTEYLEGEAAQIWEKDTNDVLMDTIIHGRDPKSIYVGANWKVKQ